MIGSDDSTADLGSEGRKDICIEGVPFRNLMEKGVGNKRSNSDFTYAGHDGLDKFHPVKIYRGGSGSDQSRRANDEENFYRSRTLLKTTTTLSQADEYSAIRDRPVGMNVPGNIHYPSYISPFVHQVHPIAFRDPDAAALVISHAASDEGSRNGKNESGGHVMELSGSFVTGKKLKIGVTESESPILGRKKSSSSSRKMTIFYDGHAYVFDDIHPYKAEVIMAMAGSNAGSFLSTFTAKAHMRQVKDGCTPTGEIETGTASNTDIARNRVGKPVADVNSTIHEFMSSDQISTFPGDEQDSKGVI